MIHPTAIIDPLAQIDPTASVGPYAVIDGPVQIGAECQILAHAVITGRVTLGEKNTIGYGAVIGAPPQDISFRPETESFVTIGRGNTIREYCTIHRGTAPGSATTVGDENFFMAGVHLAHNVKVGSKTVIANNVLIGGHVEVQDRVFIGGGSVFHQFIRVGQMVVIQGLSAFSKDVPPFTMAAERNAVAGLNVVGMRRNGLNPGQRSEVKEAFRLLYRSGLNVRQALEKSGEREWGTHAQLFFEFVRNAKRGVCEGLEQSRISPEDD